MISINPDDMNYHYVRNTCRLCNSGNLCLVLPLNQSPLCDAYIKTPKKQDSYDLSVYLCKECDFVQINTIVDPKIIYSDYLYQTTSSSGLISHFAKYANEVCESVETDRSKLTVDIGSNDGTLLEFFRDRNHRVLGIEPAAQIAKDASLRGIQTLPIFFDESQARKILSEYGTAGLITINNLFANIDDLENFTRGLDILLDENGVLVIESSYLLAMIENMVFDFIYHEHLSYLSVKPLKKFFEQQEMSLIDVLRVDTKGGSLRYYASNLSTDNSTTLNVDEWLKLENKKELYEITRYDQYAETILKGKSDLNSFLSNYQKESVIGYGASATSTTLIYHYDLSNKLDCLVDDNPAKVSTFSPGLNIPVRETKEIYRAGVEVVVILAWRYAKEIIQKHSRFNGVFVIPLPELVIHQES